MSNFQGAGRILALTKKEIIQIKSDPSAFIIVIVLPLILLFIFGYGMNLDNNRIKIALVNHELPSLSSALAQSPFFDIVPKSSLKEAAPELIKGHVRGIIEVSENFLEHQESQGNPAIQVITDGSEPILAVSVKGYAQGAIASWRAGEASEAAAAAPPGIEVESRTWYNPDLKSRDFLIPGAISIIMTLVGTLLTALVVAKEWDQGSMEFLMGLPVSPLQIILGKLVPYFLLGMTSMGLCFLVATLWYHVPFRGSFFALVLVSAMFLLAALGQGLLISAATRNQLAASMAATASGFLPAFMLSGFIYEISNMPTPIRLLSYIVPARYFVTSLQTLFLVGDAWTLVLECMFALGLIALVFFYFTWKKSQKSLD